MNYLVKNDGEDLTGKSWLSLKSVQPSLMQSRSMRSDTTGDISKTTDSLESSSSSFAENSYSNDCDRDAENIDINITSITSINKPDGTVTLQKCDTGEKVKKSEQEDAKHTQIKKIAAHKRPGTDDEENILGESLIRDYNILKIEIEKEKNQRKALENQVSLLQAQIEKSNSTPKNLNNFSFEEPFEEFGANKISECSFNLSKIEGASFATPMVNQANASLMQDAHTKLTEAYEMISDLVRQLNQRQQDYALSIQNLQANHEKKMERFQQQREFLMAEAKTKSQEVTKGRSEHRKQKRELDSLRQKYEELKASIDSKDQKIQELEEEVDRNTDENEVILSSMQSDFDDRYHALEQEADQMMQEERRKYEDMLNQTQMSWEGKLHETNFQYQEKIEGLKAEKEDMCKEIMELKEALIDSSCISSRQKSATSSLLVKEDSQKEKANHATTTTTIITTSEGENLTSELQNTSMTTNDIDKTPLQITTTPNNPTGTITNNSSSTDTSHILNELLLQESPNHYDLLRTVPSLQHLDDQNQADLSRGFHTERWRRGYNAAVVAAGFKRNPVDTTPSPAPNSKNLVDCKPQKNIETQLNGLINQINAYLSQQDDDTRSISAFNDGINVDDSIMSLGDSIRQLGQKLSQLNLPREDSQSGEQEGEVMMMQSMEEDSLSADVTTPK
mmetsp:Transcript_9266/g.10082  ORF Transcript_9266/g.10082 Transcript_9266/m.10082 type:complete len:677 (-) Transcript_9266:281-2311(-)